MRLLLSRLEKGEKVDKEEEKRKMTEEFEKRLEEEVAKQVEAELEKRTQEEAAKKTKATAKDHAAKEKRIQVGSLKYGFVFIVFPCQRILIFSYFGRMLK